MKTTTIAAMLAFMAIPSMGLASNSDSHGAAPDTTLTYRGRKITVSDDGRNLSVSVTDGKGGNTSQIYVSTSDSARREQTWQVEDDFDMGIADLLPRMIKKNKSAFCAHSQSFYVGFNNAIGAGVDNALGRSIEIGFTPIARQHRHSAKSGMWYGLGFNWRNYKLDDNRRFIYARHKVSIADAADTIDVTKSRLRTFRFCIPVAYEWQPAGGNRIFFQLGGTLEIAPSARIFTEYRVNGTKHKDRDKSLNHNVLGGSIFASLGYGDWGLYARYTPTPLFSSKNGPDFTSLSFGIRYCL